MNEQLQQALASIITKAVSSVENGVEFLSGQVPDVIEQLLTWKLTEAVLLCIVFLLFSSIVTWKCYRKIKANGDYCFDDGLIALFLFTLLVDILSVAMVGIYLLEAIQILIAPKVYLIEYASQLVK